jgi:hypothetical protein
VGGKSYRKLQKLQKVTKVTESYKKLQKLQKVTNPVSKFNTTIFIYPEVMTVKVRLW